MTIASSLKTAALALAIALPVAGAAAAGGGTVARPSGGAALVPVSFASESIT